MTDELRKLVEAGRDALEVMANHGLDMTREYARLLLALEAAAWALITDPTPAVKA